MFLFIEDLVNLFYQLNFIDLLDWGHLENYSVWKVTSEWEYWVNLCQENQVGMRMEWGTWQVVGTP